MKKLLAGALVALGLALALLAGAIQGAAPSAATNPDMSVGYGLNSAHDGYITDSALAPPLKRLWAVDLQGSVSYPLVVGNYVYVVAAHVTGDSGGVALYALDVHTGATVWGPVEQGGSYWATPLAYDDGRLLALNSEGILRAYDAQTGTPAWSTEPMQLAAFAAPPVAHQGIVYVLGAYGLSAFDTTTGTELWANNSHDSLPAVSDDAVYATGCGTLTAYAPRTGAVRWEQRSDDCGHKIALALAWHAGRLYLTTLSGTLYVFDAATGKQLQIYSADTLPAFAGGRGFSLNQGRVQGFDEASGTIQWTFAGDGDLVGPAIVVHNALYVHSIYDTVYVLDPASGRQLFTTPLLAPGTPPDPPAQPQQEPPPPLSAGSGELLVPGYHWLVAFGPAGGSLPALPSPTPRRVAPAPTDATDLTGMFQGDAAHTGSLPGDALTPPLRQLWSVDLTDPVANPLVVGSLVYVTAGRWLTALDVRSGAVAWGPVAQGGRDSSALLAYDNGQIFAAAHEGIVRAYNARTGVPTWSTILPKQVFLGTHPTATKGVLYLTGSGSGSTLFALDEATGAVRWMADAVTGSPAVSDSAIYIDGESAVLAYTHTGDLRWQQQVDFIFSPAWSVAVYRDRVYASGGGDEVYVFDAASGKQLQIYAGSALLAFAGPRGFMLTGGHLQAFDVTTGATLWSFAGSGDLRGAPFVVHNTVYVGSASGTLYGVDAATGRMVASVADLGDSMGIALGAGSGELVVPTGSHLVAFTSASGGPAPAPPPDLTGPRRFPETGHTLQGRFRQYWEEHGGLSQQGYPLSDEFSEVSALDGKSYTVQYFERAVFEYHPENTPPYDVLLTQLGTYRYRQLYPQGAPRQQRNPNSPQYFAQTGHAVGGSFRPYWEQHGGLAQFGYPLSDEFAETSDLDGQTYTVQYFERAVFEWHPENAPPYNILLSQLGTYRLRQVYPQGPPTP